MSESNMSEKESDTNTNAENSESYLKKVLNESYAINNFQTNCQFTRDLGLELIKGSPIDEHIEILESAIKGVKDFIDLIEEKIALKNK